MSSMFERCRDPIMPSATTAANSDSMAASSAIVIADGNISCTKEKVTVGTCGAGSDEGTPPKREPMVSTGSDNRCTTTVVATMATSEPGTLVVKRGHRKTTRSAAAPTASACGLKLDMAWA